MPFLSLDTETGGIGLDKSLLTIGLYFVSDQDFDYKYYYQVKPNDGVYHVDAQGLSVNNIDLVTHNPIAITYKDMGSILYSHLSYFSQSGKNKITIVGKSVHGDINQICNKLISRGSWDQFVEYVPMDIGVIWKFLEISGKLPAIDDYSLRGMCEYFNIPATAYHNALADAVATWDVFDKMRKL